MQALVRKRGHIKGSITKLISSVSACLWSKDQVLIAQKEERLRYLYATYEELCLEIAALDDNSEDQENQDEAESKYTKALLALRKGQLDIISTTSVSAPIQPSKIKLPAIQVPTFTGKLTEYRTFINLFNSLIHKDASLDNIQKLYYLQSFLCGEPYELIKNLPLVDNSYPESLKLLDERYNNVFKIRSEHIDTLLSLQPIIKSNAVNLRGFICIVKQEMSALKNLATNVDSWDPIVLCILSKKLDTYTKQAYQMSRDHSVEPSINEFLDFLGKRALALENVEPIASTSAQANKTHVTQAQKTSTVAHVVASKASTSKVANCVYCKYEHKLFSCPQFKLLSAAERLKFVKDKNLCIICLNNHDKKCRFYFKCVTCKGQHNTLLHDSESTSPNSAVVTMIAGQPCQKVLLPTVRVKIRMHDGMEVNVRALLDSASQSSFVTSDLVKLLNLKTSAINETVAGIGNTNSSIKASVQLEVCSTTSQFKTLINCYVIDKITSTCHNNK